MSKNNHINLATFIQQQYQVNAKEEQEKAVQSIGNVKQKENDEEQEYVYWARRGGLETANEVEISSCEKKEEETSTVNIEDIQSIESRTKNNAIISAELLNQARLQDKRESEKLQEKVMNEEYQKAIEYLLCSNKSKSGKQKKKQTMTAYLFFCRRYRSKIVSRNPKLTFAQISKLLSHMWRNASEQEKNTYRMKLAQHRTEVNAMVEKNMIEKMKIVKEQKCLREKQKDENKQSSSTLDSESSIASSNVDSDSIIMSMG